MGSTRRGYRWMQATPLTRPVTRGGFQVRPVPPAVAVSACGAPDTEHWAGRPSKGCSIVSEQGNGRADTDEQTPGAFPRGTTTYRLGFRGDIEGMRAVAILLVVAAHAKIPGVAGGYIGVDMFFVLSGYLITGLLVHEAQSSGHIRILDFYARRLRRLLPALLLMIMCTGLAAAVLLSPLEQIDQVATMRSAVFWFSNLHFAFANLNYFAAGTNTNLFLHTWSLGVEEQFYLVWPVLLMLLLGSFRWQGAVCNLRRLQIGMLATVAVCFGLSQMLMATQPIWAFYLMPSRAWQFALGALTLLWSVQNRDQLRSDAGGIGRLVAPAGWAGIALILATAAYINEQTVYPGLWALVPSVGAALVLVAGSSPNPTSITRILSVRPMQGIGRVSYSWYLWHWPVLILGGAAFQMNALGQQMALAGISLILAVIAHWAIELPLRRNPLLISRPGLTLMAATVLMIGAFAANIGWRSFALTGSVRPDQQRYQAISGDRPVIYAMGCDEFWQSDKVQICPFGNAAAAHTAIIIGDSYVAQWFPAIAAAYHQPDWRVLVLTKSSCPMIDQPFYYVTIRAIYTVCDRWRDAALTQLGSLHPDVVFMGESWNYGASFTESQWISGTQRVLDRIVPIANNVFIIRPTAGLPFDGPGCLARRDWQPAFLPTPKDCSGPATSQRNTEIYRWLTQAANPYPNVRVLDLNALICPNDRCSAERDGQVIFRDTGHVTATYMATLGDALAARVAQP